MGDSVGIKKVLQTRPSLATSPHFGNRLRTQWFTSVCSEEQAANSVLGCCSEKMGRHCVRALGCSQDCGHEKNWHLLPLLKQRDEDTVLSSKVGAKGSTNPAGVADPNCVPPVSQHPLLPLPFSAPQAWQEHLPWMEMST